MSQRRSVSSQGSRGSKFQQKAMKLPRLLANGEGQHFLENYGLDIGVNSQQGKRPYQEDEFSIKPYLKQKGGLMSNDGSTPDTHFFGLFDGHAGGKCSKFVSNSFTDILIDDPAFSHSLPQAVKRTFFSTNEQFLQIAERMKLHDGSTGICSIVRDGKVLVSNVGDCRCLILSNGKPIQMSVDQKPTSPDEQRRIAALGGTVVFCMGTARVNGVLAVSRAFGNRTLRSVIRPDPELSMREFTRDDDYLIMASDGLWDVLRNIDVCNIVYSTASQAGVGGGNFRNNTMSNANNNNNTPICQQLSEELVNSALNRGSLDNVTCIVVKISGPNGLYQAHQNSTTNAANKSLLPDSGSNTSGAPTPTNRAVTAAAAASYRSRLASGGTASPINTNPDAGVVGGINISDNENGNPNGNSSSIVVDMLSAIMSSTSGGARGNKNNNNNNANGRLHSGTKKSHHHNGVRNNGLGSFQSADAASDIQHKPPKISGKSNSLRNMLAGGGRGSNSASGNSSGNSGDESDNLTVVQNNNLADVNTSNGNGVSNGGVSNAGVSNAGVSNAGNNRLFFGGHSRLKSANNGVQNNQTGRNSLSYQQQQQQHNQQQQQNQSGGMRHFNNTTGSYYNGGHMNRNEFTPSPVQLQHQQGQLHAQQQAGNRRPMSVGGGMGGNNYGYSNGGNASASLSQSQGINRGGGNMPQIFANTGNTGGVGNHPSESMFRPPNGSNGGNHHHHQQHQYHLQHNNSPNF